MCVRNGTNFVVVVFLLSFLSYVQNWYELQLQQILQWLEKRPEFSLHAAQVQASKALTDVCFFSAL